MFGAEADFEFYCILFRTLYKVILSRRQGGARNLWILPVSTFNPR
jgi:hypothetical protein